MRSLPLLACIGSTLLSCSVAAGASESLRALREASTQTVSGVVRLASENYTRFVLDSPRDYDLVVFYTASEAKFGCVACVAVAKELRIAAQSLSLAVSLDTQDAFFAVADFKTTQDAFMIHGFKSVPHLAAWPRTSPDAKRSKHDGRSAVNIPTDKLTSPTDGLLTASQIIALMPSTRYHVPVQRPAEERTPWAVLIAVACGLLGSLIAIDRANILFFTRKWFWVCASLAVFAVSVSGAISCVIKSSPWFGTKQDGRLVLFSSGGHHDQFVLEGAVIGALNLAAAAGVLLLVYSARSRKLSQFAKAVLGCLALAVFLVAYMRIVAYYQDKTRWYRLDALIPTQLRDLLFKWVWTPFLQRWRALVQPHIDVVYAHPLVTEARTSLANALGLD